MAKLNAPEALSFNGNMSDNWKKFQQRFKLYMVASGLSGKDPKIQCATLLHIVGEEALDVYNTFELDEAARNDVDTLLKRFADPFTPKKNVTYERHVFNTRVQHQGESVDQFVTDLKTKAKTCEFGGLCDRLIKDRIVVGVTDEQVRARLLRERDLSLQKAIDICHAAETSKHHLGGLNATGHTQQMPVSWKEGVVEQQANTPRPYVIQVDDAKYRRNRRDLVQTKESVNEQTLVENSPENPQEIKSQNPTDSQDPSQSSQENVGKHPRTSSGRTIRLPQRYRNDYVMK
ncbi:hypothetical protein HOLleu_29056 [Holothuria leucospilota]|uniref:Retrotransposon gag domain-containing protein n=1 Tax=Holothuria leucospilota TaxID=206669 RepID=A0A9Q1BN85_HOLLE|nr:hypothetical protein HOLleu_29056 [Holothuria leucospilota]